MISFYSHFFTETSELPDSPTKIPEGSLMASKKISKNLIFTGSSVAHIFQYASTSSKKRGQSLPNCNLTFWRVRTLIYSKFCYSDYPIFHMRCSDLHPRFFFQKHK